MVDLVSERYELDISGMTCASCAGRVERALQAVPGVGQAEVNLANERASITSTARPSELIGAVLATGFGASVHSDAPEQEQARQVAQKRQSAREALRVALALLLSLPLLLPMLGVAVPGWTQFVLAALVQVGVGAGFYRPAWRALRAGSGNMDLLVSIGTTAAFLFSVWRLVMDPGAPLFFDSAAIVLSLVALGRWLEVRARRATGEALRALSALRPQTARVARDDGEMELPVAALRVGDVVVVRPGERIPADGVVITGVSEADESLLTGESHLVPKHEGDEVIGGSVNGAGLLLIRVSARAGDSVLARIVALVESAQARKPAVQKLVDRVSAIFVPMIMLCAFASFLIWWALGQPARGVLAAVSVLVIACPCALGLATPVALMAGMGAAARAGILIRDPDALEATRSIDRVAFDKTGTLTMGHPVVVAAQPVGITTDELLRLGACVEQGSEHPLARAIVQACAGQALSPVEDFQAQIGSGVSARVEGRALVMGTQALLRMRGIDLPDALAQASQQAQAEGCTVVYLGALEPVPVCLGMVSLRDKARPQASEAVQALRAMGVQVAMLTGDNPGTARRIGTEVGITDVHAALQPQDKVAVVRNWRQAGQCIAMVGDGVNDAPALVEANLGLAIGSGTDAAIGAAGMTLMRPDPGLVADALRIGRVTLRKIRQNLTWAFLFNVLGVPMAMMGHLDPMFAGGAMAFSSVAVVSNALLLRRWRPKAQA